MRGEVRLGGVQPLAAEMGGEGSLAVFEGVFAGVPGFDEGGGDEIAAGLAEAFAIAGIVRGAKSGQEGFAAQRDAGTQFLLEFARDGGEQAQGGGDVPTS